METETKKILGSLANGIDQHPVVVSATTTRVPVHNGHTGSISVGVRGAPPLEAVIDAWRSFKGRPQDSACRRRRRSRSCTSGSRTARSPRSTSTGSGGMTVSVGRLRPCPVLDYKFVALGHNTIRGAAGAAILNAELMQQEGLL